MDWLEQLFDAKIVIGFGLGVLTASLYLIPMLKEQNLYSLHNQKMKLSTKSLPSTQDLKQVYIKKNEKLQIQTKSKLNDKQKNNKNSLKTDADQQDYYFNLDDGIRKKRKFQELDEESSLKYDFSSQSVIDNQGPQDLIQENNIKNQNETDLFSKRISKLPQFSRTQGNGLIQKIVQELQNNKYQIQIQFNNTKRNREKKKSDYNSNEEIFRFQYRFDIIFFFSKKSKAIKMHIANLSRNLYIIKNQK